MDMCREETADILDKRCQRWCYQGGEKEEDHSGGSWRTCRGLVETEEDARDRGGWRQMICCDEL